MRHGLRWLSLLAALVLAWMPAVTALGAANSGKEWTMSWQWNEELIASPLEEAAGTIDETTLALMRMTQTGPWQLLNALTFRMQCSDNMMQVRYMIDLSDQRLLDVAARQTGSRVDMIMSLLPGIVLSYATADAQAALDAWARLGRTENSLLLTTLLQELTAWADTVDFQTEVLTDRHPAAPQAETLIRWSFDDRDLAVLLDSCTEALRAYPALREALAATYGEAFLHQVEALLQEVNRAVARENVYGYHLALLLDGEEQVVGAEMSGGARLETSRWRLSLGWTDAELQAFLSLPAQPEETSALLAHLKLEDEGRKISLQLARDSGLPLEETLQKHTFAAYIGQSSQTQTDGDVRKIHEGVLALRDSETEEIIQVRGELTGGVSMTTWEGTLALTLPAYAGEPLCTLKLTQEHLPHMAWPDTADRQRVELANPALDEDAWMESIAQAQDILDQALEQGMQDLMVRMFKGMPIEIFTMLFQGISLETLLQ